MELVVSKRPPEDAELDQKRAELAELETRLSELEFQLLNLKIELAEFETLYFARVGSLYAELDEIEAEIAERAAQREPTDPRVAAEAHEARARAKESARAVEEAPKEATPKQRPETLRDLYRAVAKRIHPDLAGNDSDRHLRERLMKEANLAYEQGDEAKLRELLEEYEHSPDAICGNDIGAELVRVIRRINVARRRIQDIEAALEQLMISDTYKLKIEADSATREGRNTLEELANRLRSKIAECRHQVHKNPENKRGR
jgi:hypothetical protein